MLQPQSPPATVSANAATLALAAGVLGLALHVRDGLYSLPATAMLLVAFILVGVANFAAMPAISTAKLHVLLAAIAIFQLATMPFKPAGASSATVPVTDQTPLYAGIVAAAAAVWFIAAGCRRTRVVAFVLLLVIHAAVGVWKIRTAPSPRIDVFRFQVDSADALGRGTNPYTITFPNVYAPKISDYPSHLLRDGRVQFGYPYPPLVLWWTAPAQLLFGDFRYAQLTAVLATALILATLGKTGMLAAALLLFTPRSFYVLEMGWTEPLSAMLLAATVWCMLRQPGLVAIPFGLLLASKQYLPAMVMLTPLIARHSRGRKPAVANENQLPFARNRGLPTAAIACGVAILVTAPLALCDIRAFVHSAITLQLHQPYRGDALSFLAGWGSGDPQWAGPFWLAFIALAAAIGVSLWKSRTLSAAVAFCLFAFFAFNKQAFANYYFLVLAATCLGIAAENCTPTSACADSRIIGPCAKSSR